MIILSDKQNKALKEITKWYIDYKISMTLTKPYYVLAGIAGSGKSTIVAYLKDNLVLKDDEIVFATYTGMASSVLMSRGNKNASTIHKLIYKTLVSEDPVTKKKTFITTLKNKEEMPENIKLIVIDEYSMVPDKIINDLLTFQIPILFLGDFEQLPPIFGDNMLKYDFFLDEPHRQALDNPILLIANYARTKQFDKIRLGSYGDNVRVFSKHDFDIESLINSDQIICGKNATVKSLNTFYRANFLNRKDNLIREDEKIMCIANNWDCVNSQEFALVNGLIGKASNISLKPKAQIYELDFKPKFTTEFKNIPIDKLLFENKEIDKNTDIYRLGLKDKYGELNRFNYAYAITTHKSQGSEFPYVAFFPEMLDRKNYYRLFYTGVTRAKDKLDIIL